MSRAGKIAIRRSLAPLALMGAIFYLSSQSQTGAGFPEWARVIAHFCEYAALATLWTWALAPTLGRRALAAAVLICVPYAISDELHQGFVAGRDSDPFDVLVDTAGVTTALVAALVLAQARGGALARGMRSGGGG